MDPEGFSAASPDSAAARFAGLRAAMVRDQLEARGIREPGVLAAFRTVPRERFVPEPERARAYEDGALPIGLRQTISQPYVVARMTELLGARAGARILEIGTGSGYQTAILLAMGARVFSVERLEELTDRAEAALDGLVLSENLVLRVDDGTLGWPEEAPFDGILVTAAGPSVPPALRAQLADGGRMVIPTGEDTVCLRLIERHGDEFVEKDDLPVRFVPLIGRQGWPDERERKL